MATATMGPSSVDRLARSKRPTVERAEIHIPPAPVFPLEAVTGDPMRRARAVASFNNALQKWRNDAWSIEAPFVPDAEMQADVARLQEDAAKSTAILNRSVIDIRHAEENITNIDNSITEINNEITNINNAITGTGIVQANGASPPTAILGSTGHFPYWRPSDPHLSHDSPIYVSAGNIGIGTVGPVTELDVVGVINASTGFRVNNTATLGRVLMGDGTNIVLQTIPTQTHAVLDAVFHTDSVTQTVTRGSLVYGNATPLWDELVIGAANTVLRTAGVDPVWGKVVMTTDVTGVLPVANGGTNASSWTAGSVIFAGAGGTSLAQDNTTFFWDDTNNRLGVGTNGPAAGVDIVAVTPLRLARSGLNAFTAIISGIITGTTGGDLVWNTSQADGGFAWRINNGSTAALVIAEGGNIGIRNTNPGALLDLGLAGTTLGVMRMAGSTSGNVTIQPQAIAGTWTLQLPQNDGALGEFLTTDGSGITSWSAGASVTPAALTRVDDTNITLTLGGSPTVALLAATSLTLGWTGVLSIARGGTNQSIFGASAGVVYFDGTSLVNSADFTYTPSTLSSFGTSLNGINNPYIAVNRNTGANAGSEYQVGLADTSNNQIIAGYISWFKEQSWTTVAATQDSSATIGTTLNGATIAAILLHSSGSVVCGKDSTGTTRTDDFTYICTSNGPPTGVPTTFGSRVPMTFDPNTDTFYIYRGGWKGVVVA